MGLFNKPQKQDYPELPDNLYVAKVARISNKIGKTSGKPYISWGFEIAQPPHIKRWVWGNTQPTVSEKSQTGKFLTVLGIDIETVDMSTFDEQTLVGKYVKVLVETKEEDDGSKFQNVTKLMALTEADVQLLQIWLTQVQTSGPVKVATQANPTAAPVQQPVLAAAPVSFPAQPVLPPTPQVVQAVVQPATPAKKSAFPF